ncbi:MAG: hypothetical protein EBS83_04570 [Planctomycetia bacterium]|nr:hypothetical protein [Planctomycetia bacterium]
MSQKYVVGIVATSFVAGLLATAIVHGPQELSKADYPYFGFADESAGAATGMLGESKSWWRPTVLPSPDQPVASLQSGAIPGGEPSGGSSSRTILGR